MVLLLLFLGQQRGHIDAMEHAKRTMDCGGSALDGPEVALVPW